MSQPSPMFNIRAPFEITKKRKWAVSANFKDVEAACQRLASAFVTYVDNDRFAETSKLFTADGTFQRATGVTFRGPEQIAAALADRPADFKTVHHVSPLFVELDGENEARGASSLVVYVKDHARSALTPVVVAIWHDRYRRENGEWLIAERAPKIILKADF